MPATQNLTEQAPCPHHSCPRGIAPWHWYNYSYCFPNGSKNAEERLEYWEKKALSPLGCWWNCPICWEMDSYRFQQIAIARDHIADREKQLRKKMVKNGKHKGYWELTLNYAPAWYQDDIEAQAALRTALDRLMRYYKNDLTELRATGEFTKDRRAHLHVMYQLQNGGKFTDKNLKRAYPHWNAKVKIGKGNQGGHHAPVDNEADFRGYIEKDLHDSWFQLTYPNDQKVVSQEENESSPSSPPSPSSPDRPTPPSHP